MTEKKEEVQRTSVSPRKANDSGVAEKGNTVKIHYTGTLDDGTTFDTSEGREPIEFTIGQGQVIPGFEEAVIGMKVGDKKEVTLPPEQAYGQKHDGLQQKVPMEAFGGQKPQVGQTLALQHPQAPQPLPAQVLKVEDDGVTLDLNHPLAGKILNFKIELAELN